MLTTDEIPFGEEAENTVYFAEGNQKDLIAWKESLERKAKMITNTIEPLIEISLVKLLGNSNEYEKFKSDIFTDENFKFTVMFLYKVKKWFAPGTNPEAIKKDAMSIYANLSKIQDVHNWIKCEINVEKGTLEVVFEI